jgi:hypothetical protein
VSIFTYRFQGPGAGIAQPNKVVDVGSRLGVIYIQVLDASTLFIGTNRDTMLQLAGNKQQGLQQVVGDRRLWYPWKGELWVMSDTNGAQFDWELIPDVLSGVLAPRSEVTNPSGIQESTGFETFEEECGSCAI